MSNFGDVKTKLLVKLTESYTSDNKSGVKDLLKQIKSNKNLVEMYLFYEDIENKHIPSVETAKLFVEQIETLLIQKSKLLGESLSNLSGILKDVNTDKNEIYECLDILSEDVTLLNVEKKVVAKEKLLKNLTSPKQTQVSESTVHTDNQSLLNAVLVNNFNTKFTDFMNEEQKESFKKIVTMKDDELSTEMSSLKESMTQKFDKLISEESDSTLIDKLSQAKKEVTESTVSKFNYYRLVELSKSLD
jgi:succinate dehydrogenase flavin-adding protein (antitoxin of CptAB toxin-antitoxin module)